MFSYLFTSRNPTTLLLLIRSNSCIRERLFFHLNLFMGVLSFCLSVDLDLNTAVVMFNSGADIVFRFFILLGNEITKKKKNTDFANKWRREAERGGETDGGGGKHPNQSMHGYQTERLDHKNRLGTGINQRHHT